MKHPPLLFALPTLVAFVACSEGYGLSSLDSTTPAGGDDSSPVLDPGGKDSTPTDTGPVDPIPKLTSFTVEEVEDRVRFTFVIEDGDDNLRGGSATVEVSGLNTVSYAIPNQVVSAGNDTYYVAWKQDLFTPEQTYSCAVWAYDQSGNSSNTLTETYARSAWSASVTEKGDELGDASGVGLVQTPGVISGDIDKASNDGVAHTGDIDFVKFRVESSRSYRITLTWAESAADYDLYLMQAGPVTLDSSAGYQSPERITYTLQAATDYFLAIAGWSGPAGDWTVRIE